MSATIARSGAALGARALLVMAAGMVRIAFVARALGPEDLGVFALLSAVVEGVRAMTALGPTSVIVQRAEVPQSFIDTLWVFKLGQGCLLALGTLAAYPVMAHFAPSGSVWWLHVVLAAALLLASLSSPAVLLETRRSSFGRVAFVEAAAAVVDCVVTIWLAYQLESVIALGFGALARAATEVGLSFALFPMRIKLAFDRQAAREFFGAGWYLLLGALGAYVTIYGDNALIGAVLGAQALGFYVVAYRLAEIPFSSLFSVTRRLLFPVLSRLQSDPPRLRVVVRETLLLQMLLLWPAVAGLTIFSEFIVTTVYGAPYLEAAVVLRALGLLSLGRAVAILLGTVLLAAGRYEHVTQLKWLEVVVFLPALALGLHWGGLVGAALGAGAAYALAALLRSLSLLSHIGLTRAETVRSLLLPAVPTAVVAGLVLGLRRFVPQPVVLIAIFAVVYVAVVLLTQRAVLGTLRGAMAQLGGVAAPREG